MRAGSCPSCSLFSRSPGLAAAAPRPCTDPWHENASIPDIHPAARFAWPAGALVLALGVPLLLIWLAAR